MIHIENLLKVYKGSSVPAVNNISLSIDKGEIFGLLGTNGAGKTTTFSMLCGLFLPTSGNIFVKNMSVRTKMKDIKKITGVVPQNIALYPTLTGKENLMFFGRMYGIKKSILKDKVMHHLASLGLENHANKKTKQYSGGMKRRINLIAGLLHEPEILLLDEPAVGIDAHSRLEIMEYLKKVNQSGTTIVYTSHYLEEAEKFCSKIAVIDEGKIITEGKPDHLIEKEQVMNLEELFFKLTKKRGIV
jgi:ABC-2 type transport system ATP-binding protein